MMMVIQYGDKIASSKDEYEKIVNDITIDKALETLDTKEKEIERRRNQWKEEAGFMPSWL